MTNQYGQVETIRDNIFRKFGQYQAPNSLIGAAAAKAAREKYALGEARKGYVEDEPVEDEAATVEAAIVDKIAPETQGAKLGLNYKQAQRIMGKEYFDMLPPREQAQLLDAVRQMTYEDARMFLQARME